MLTDPAVFQRDVAAYADSVRATRPLREAEPVRVPFERSRIDRERRRASNAIDVADTVVAALQTLHSPRGSHQS